MVDGGEDVFDGGEGHDTVDFSSSVSGVSVDLPSGTLVDGSGSVDEFTSLESVIGSGFSDVITGSSTSEVLFGGNGSDIITGGGGTDVIDGGGGDDVLEVDGSFGGTIEGGSGSDSLDLVGLINQFWSLV